MLRQQLRETTEASSSEVTTTDSDATWNRYPVGQYTWGVKESLHGQVTGGVMVAIEQEALLAQGLRWFNTCDGSSVCWTDGGYGHVGYNRS